MMRSFLACGLAACPPAALATFVVVVAAAFLPCGRSAGTAARARRVAGRRRPGRTPGPHWSRQARTVCRCWSPGARRWTAVVGILLEAAPGSLWTWEARGRRAARRLPVAVGPVRYAGSA